jgi:large subunit ribosomal protein LP0
MPKSKTFPSRSAWKANYFEKLESAMRNHSKFLLVNADNVASLQFAQIRATLRGKATIVMGKNTMMKKCIKGVLEDLPEYEKVMPLLVQNVGFVFTNNDLKEIRDEVLANKVAAPARAGAIVPPGVDVIVPAQNTGMGPEKTSFFQALSIQTKIARGTIEIVTPVHLLKPGDKVGASEATLLNMLKISPFSYGLKVEACYDEGSVFEPEVLDITEDDIRARFMAGVNNVAAVSLNIGYPTVASAPHSIANALKKLIAVAAATDITFEAAEKTKAYLADPSAFASAAPAVEEKKEEAAPAAKEESEEESDSDMGFDLFG